MLSKEKNFFNFRIEVQERITFTVRVAKCLGLRWSVGDLEASQGSISISSLDSGHHPH